MLFVVGAVAVGLAAAARGRFVGVPAVAAVAREGAWPVGGSHAGALAAGEGCGARAERGECLAQPVGFAGEMVKVVLDLLTQAVDHLALRPRSGGSDGTYPRR